MSEAGSDARHLWFLNTRVTARVSYRDGTDGISVLEHQAPHGDSPPLHVHRNEDEVFHVLVAAASAVLYGVVAVAVVPS